MAVIKLTIYVANLTNAMSLFDEIQIWRSVSGIGGTYEEITDNGIQPAEMTGTETAPFTLNGLSLDLKVNAGSEQTVNFVTADPINIDDVVDILNDDLTDLVASEDTGAVVLTSDLDGTGASIEITGGSALTELGFTLDQLAQGRDDRLTLTAGVSTYQHDDQGGDTEAYYKTRYYNSATGAVSAFGDPVKGDIGSIITPTELIKGTVSLAELDGRPYVEKRVIFYNVRVPPMLIDGSLVVGRQVTVETDQAGYAETMLVKGSTVDVTISGTGIVRRITVPSTGTEFDVMGAVAAADDVFQVQVPDIPAAVRRS